jgi:hypothetical protein
MDTEVIVIEVLNVQSLLWDGDTLVDWVSGGTRIGLDGIVQPRRVHFAYRFDSAIASPSGQFVIVFEKLGTKALLLDRGKVLRELDRSFYFAHTYEFPVAFTVLPDGREAIVHCPHEYCRIDIEVAETGECLTDHVARKPKDMFHSRLTASPQAKYLASAGWIWHPFSTAALWSLEEVLQDSAALDGAGLPLSLDNEVESLAFTDDERLAVAFGREGIAYENADEKLSVLSVPGAKTINQTRLSSPAGTLIPFSHNTILSLYEHPRMLRISDASVTHEWSHLSTGRQQSSIIHQLDRIPAFAKHPTRPMFALAGKDKVTVVSVGEAAV